MLNKEMKEWDGLREIHDFSINHFLIDLIATSAGEGEMIASNKRKDIFKSHFSPEPVTFFINHGGEEAEKKKKKSKKWCEFNLPFSLLSPKYFRGGFIIFSYSEKKNIVTIPIYYFLLFVLGMKKWII